MPGTSVSSSMTLNRLCVARQARIFAAVTGPMPGKRVELLGGGRVQVEQSP